MNHDVIGDIHGHADKLTALLQKLGYRHHLGAWRHPDRTAIFVGDFIDRGGRNLETIGIVREMRDAGTALAVMGNHEFNAIAWHTSHPEREGEHLRPRNGKNRFQHEAFLAETEHDPELHGEQIEWFLTLPLWLDLPGLRVVHACWHPGYMAEIEPFLKPGRRLDLDLVTAASRRGTMEYRTVEGLLKGLEVALPPGHEFHDKDGYGRRDVRVRWWDAVGRHLPQGGDRRIEGARGSPRYADSELGADRLRPSQARVLRPLLVFGDTGPVGAARGLRRLLRRQGRTAGGVPLRRRSRVERRWIRQRMSMPLKSHCLRQGETLRWPCRAGDHVLWMRMSNPFAANRKARSVAAP